MRVRTITSAVKPSSSMHKASIQNIRKFSPAFGAHALHKSRITPLRALTEEQIDRVKIDAEPPRFNVDTQDDMDDAIKNHYVLARAIRYPHHPNKFSPHIETNIETELRKIAHTIGKPTLTKPESDKFGNKNQNRLF